jgi:hypothetical protein
MSLRLTFSSFYGHYHKQANVGHTSLFRRLLSGKGLQYRTDLDDFLVAFGFRKLSNMVFLAYFDLILAFIPRSLSKCKYTASHPTYSLDGCQPSSLFSFHIVPFLTHVPYGLPVCWHSLQKSWKNFLGSSFIETDSMSLRCISYGSFSDGLLLLRNVGS